jgi:GH24 family phage-related lysozyme (muramidase)
MDPDLFAQLRKQLQVPAVQADATAVASRKPRPLRAKPPVGMQLPATSRIRAVLDSVLPIPGRMRDPDPETIRRAVEFITEEEKFRPNAYKDRVGVNHPWTVGYGRTGPDVDSLTTMTEREARRWTEQRTRENAQAIMREGAEPHPALLSYAYNAGFGGLRKTGALKAAAAGDWNRVADIIERGATTGSNAAGERGVVLRGLVTRRQREAELIRRDSPLSRALRAAQ